jgi:hypothetical protein
MNNCRLWYALGIVLACLLSCNSVSAETITGHYEDTTLEPTREYKEGTVITLQRGHIDTGDGGTAEDLQFTLKDKTDSYFFCSESSQSGSSKFSFVYSGIDVTFSVTDPPTLTPLGIGLSATIVADLAAVTDLTGTGLEEFGFAEFMIDLPVNGDGPATWDIKSLGAIPEPSSWLLALSGLVGLAGMSWAKKLSFRPA